jgi:hemerythrin
MSELQPNAEFMLGEPSIDASHANLFAALARIPAQPSPDFSTAFNACVAAIERDFRAEEILMEEFGLPMPPAHLEQHARMLAGLHHAAAALAEGDARPASYAVALLGDWLPVHIGTMDRALAEAVCKVREDMRRARR